MGDRNLSRPNPSTKPPSAGLVASLSSNLTVTRPAEDVHKSDAPIPPTSPTLQQPSPAGSTKSSRSRKKINSIEMIVPAPPKDLIKKSDWPVINLATRIDRLERFLQPKSPEVDAPSYWTVTPMPAEALKKLLFGAPLLRIDELTALIDQIINHYYQTDKVWISKVCHMLAQAKTCQLQIVSIARTLQNLFNGPTSNIAYLESLGKCPWAEKNNEFEIKLKLIDIDEKTAIILEHEKLFLHVAELAEKMHSMTATDTLVASILRQDINQDNANCEKTTLEVLASRVCLLENRARALVEQVMKLEANILSLAQTIQSANSLHASICRLQLLKDAA